MTGTGSDSESRPERVDDPLFLALVSNLQVMTFVHLGKLAEPGSKEPARDLHAARAGIDMLQMLRHKTSGNLSDEEARLLDHVIFELQMNYVDESSKPDAPPESSDPTAEASPPRDESSADDAEKG